MNLQATNVFGQRMKEQVASRLDQLKSGQKVAKGDPLLEDVVEELKSEGLYVSSLKKRKSKKDKKVVENEETVEAEVPKKKKKKSIAE